MTQVDELPNTAPLASFHVLQGSDGTVCVARFNLNGWTLYKPMSPVTSAELREDGYKLIRSIHEGRRVILPADSD